jgi:hypothetical protein
MTTSDHVGSLNANPIVLAALGECTRYCVGERAGWGWDGDCKISVFAWYGTLAIRTEVFDTGAAWRIHSLHERFEPYTISLPTSETLEYIKGVERESHGKAT